MAQTLDHCYVKTIKFTLSSLGHLHSTVVTSGYFCFHLIHWQRCWWFFPLCPATQQPQFQRGLCDTIKVRFKDRAKFEAKDRIGSGIWFAGGICTK